MQTRVHPRVVRLLGLAVVPLWCVATSAGSVTSESSCNSASLPKISPEVRLHADFPVAQIPFPADACIVRSASTPTGTRKDIYAEALLPRQRAALLADHFAGVLVKAGFKQVAEPVQDTSGSAPRILLRYAGADATVMSRQVLKGTGVHVVVREDSGFPAWSAVSVGVTLRPD